MHLMIDLETLSLAPKAVITQIGWAEFDPHGDAVYNSGCVNLNPDEQIKWGREISWSTLEWWLKQSQKAQQTLLDRVSKEPNCDILCSFINEFDWDTIEGVWGNGTMFDLVLLENLLAHCGYKAPWHYRAPRDFKTLRALRPNVQGPKPEIAHSAEHDAIAQALQVQLIMKDIG